MRARCSKVAGARRALEFTIYRAVGFFHFHVNRSGNRNERKWHTRHLQALENPPPLRLAPRYVAMDTWHETMCASLEATCAPFLDQDRAARPDGFRPAVVRLVQPRETVLLDSRRPSKPCRIVTWQAPVAATKNACA